MRIFSTLCLLFMLSTSWGQDVHFTNFTLAPQSYSPASIGAFAGTYRASGIIRDQYNNGSDVKGFRTIEATIDVPIIKGFRDQDWIGIGFSLDRDQRGTLKLTDMLTRMGAAYHLGLDKKSTRFLSVGIQFANLSRRISQEDLVSGGLIVENKQQFIDTYFNGANGPKVAAKDWIAGLSYTMRAKGLEYKFGVTGTHFLKNSLSFKDGRFDQPTKVSVFMQGKQSLSPQLSIEPAALVQAGFRSSGFEISAHNMFGYKLKKEDPYTLKAGLGFRTGTFSAQYLFGADYKGFYGTVAYDMPFGGYGNAPGIQNAFEMGLGYIGIINKKPKTTPVIICPRL